MQKSKFFGVKMRCSLVLGSLSFLISTLCIHSHASPLTASGASQEGASTQRAPYAMGAPSATEVVFSPNATLTEGLLATGIELGAPGARVEPTTPDGATAAASDLDSNQHEKPVPVNNGATNFTWKPQLPVANSHLKRPAPLADDRTPDSAEVPSSAPDMSATVSIANTVASAAPSPAAGDTSPKSADPVRSTIEQLFGRPNVAGEAPGLMLASTAAAAVERAAEPAEGGLGGGLQAKQTSFPEPLGRRNESSLLSAAGGAPEAASLSRSFEAHVTRTRITTGGGYVRDKLPSPAALQDYSEPANRERAPDPMTVGSGLASKVPYETTRDEVTRVIKVPERIVLPMSAVVSIELEVAKPANGGSSFAPTVALLAHHRNKTTSSLAHHHQKRDPRCPKEGSALVEHPHACDKWLQCQNGFALERTCPNGLLFSTRPEDAVIENCAHRWRVNCEEKSIPNPISSPGCRWQFGLFNVQGSPRCSPDYYECFAGKFEVKKCPIEGQVYHDATKSCQFAERIGCIDEILMDFQCPPDDHTNTYWPFPRYMLNDRALVHCISDRPQIVRCADDERVDPEHLSCVPALKTSLLAERSVSVGGASDMGPKSIGQAAQQTPQPSA